MPFLLEGIDEIYLIILILLLYGDVSSFQGSKKMRNITKKIKNKYQNTPEPDSPLINIDQKVELKFLELKFLELKCL